MTKTKRPSLQEEREFVKILFHGDPGSGKTTAAAHMAKLGRVVYVTAEPGLKALPLRRLGVPLENLHPFREITFEAVEALFRELYDELSTDPDAYAGVVLDSFSELQNKLLENDANGKFLLSQQDYNINTQKMTLLLRHFSDLPCHVAFIAHTKRDEDSDGETIYRPSVTPKLSGSLLGYVDLVCVTKEITRPDSEESDHVGLFRGGKYRAKDRYGCLPPRLFNPTFDRITAYVDGTYRREALKAAVEGSEVPDGLDPEQYDYHQRVMAARKAASDKENAA